MKDYIIITKPDVKPKPKWIKYYYKLGTRKTDREWYQIWAADIDMKDDFFPTTEECFGKSIVKIVEVKY